MPDSTDKMTTGPEETEKGVSKIPALRTLKTDTAEYVKKSGASLVSIAAEGAAASGGLKFREIKKKPAFKIIILSAVMVVAGIGLILFFLFGKGKTEEPPQISLIKPILVSDEQVEIAVDFSKGDNIEKIKKAVEKQTGVNKFLYIALVKQDGEQKRLAGTQDFFQLIKADLPLGLIDSLDNKFMLAKFYLSKDWPILLFKIKSYEYAFSGMLEWEKKMSGDLAEVFSLNNISEIQGIFEDKEIQSRDTRLLKDKEGNPVLFYSFINRDYLVITTNEEPLKEIFRRFSLPQYLNQ